MSGEVVPFLRRYAHSAPAYAFGSRAVCPCCARCVALYLRTDGSRVLRLHHTETSVRDSKGLHLRGVLCPGSRRISSARSAPSTPPTGRAA